MEKQVFVGFKATEEERNALKAIMKHRQRHTMSDTLRNLIYTESKKILHLNKTVDFNK